jgi:quercetin dioxygenase-like cupin family protein
MQLRKTRWSRHYESAEEELLALLKLRRIDAERWTADTDQVFAAHAHTYDTQLWCAEGLLVVVADGRRFSLQPGDVLDIPAGVEFEITVGLGGCACYESGTPEPRA